MNPMTQSLLFAAISGAVLGVTGGANASQRSANSAIAMTASSNGMSAMAGDKHACKGQNGCKGQGGCKTDKHACKGQNACKGQGGCKG